MQFRSVFKTFIFAAFFVAVASIAIQAQTGAFSGKVFIKKADGTTVPVADATVTPYRTDQDNGSVKAVTTNKDGEFSVFGVHTAQEFAILVTGPGIAPAIQPGFKAGMNKVPVEVREGDGSSYTEEEVRRALKQSAELTDADRERLQKEAAANAEARKKAVETNKAVNEALKAGDTAFKAKDYDTAITKFDEGVNLDPDFAGSAPILLNYKGATLKEQALDAYRASLKGDREAQLAIAKTKFDEATKAFDQGLAVLGAAKPETPKETESYAQSKYNILNNYVDVLRLAFQTQADQSKAAVAEPIYTQYFELEKDAARKAKAKSVLADMTFSTGDVDKAIAMYREVIAAQPDQPDALSGLGIALYTNGEINENPAELQEAANLLAKFLKVAPEKHLNRQTAETLLESLKTDKKITPKK
jgi:tetratricopeptide (TPR) repeat protein